jgi:hypothetical protein
VRNPILDRPRARAAALAGHHGLDTAGALAGWLVDKAPPLPSRHDRDAA